MEPIKVEDYIPHVNGYRRCAFEVLARALDDICPIENAANFQTDEERQTAEKEYKESIENRIQRFEESEVALDNEWFFMERDAEKELHDLLKEREESLKKLSETYNNTEVEEKVRFYENEMNERIFKVVSDINRLRNSYLERSARAKNRRKPIPRKEFNDKLRSFTAEITEKTTKIRQRYYKIIENAKKGDNKDKVEARIKEAEGVWDRRFNRLRRKFALREENHNHKRLENDSIRLSLDWFINDFERVAYWCLLANVDLELCYTGVKRRLDLIGRHSIEFNKIFDKVKRGEIKKADLGLVKSFISNS